MGVNDRRYGFARQHRKLREAIAPSVPGTACRRCGKPIREDERWDLDHTDDRQTYLGPSHATCNRRVGGRRGARKTNAMRAARARLPQPRAATRW